MKKIKILGNCATETATFFGGEVVVVPADVPETLAKKWIKDGLAEDVVEGNPEGDSGKHPDGG